MKKIEITNTYHHTVETVWAESLESAKTENESLVSIMAERLAENGVDQDWEDYYKTYDGIFEQLKSEFEYKELDVEWVELLEEYHLNEYGHDDFLEDHIETIEGITNEQEYDLSDEQKEKLALQIVEFMKWTTA